MRREVATSAVNEAFRRFADNPSVETKAAYDLAYARWEELVGPITPPGPGRPQNGQRTLTSSERAQALRERHRQLATRWERAAPLIQQLRKAIKDNNNGDIRQIAEVLCEETAMVLKDFVVVHEQPDSWCVVVHAFDGRDLVVSFISRETLEDYFHRNGVTGKAANLVVDRNLDAFARIISAKYERGEHKPYGRYGSTLRRVDITLDDIEASGETLTDSVLSMEWSWQPA